MAKNADNIILVEIGNRIAALRNERGITLRALADEIDSDNAHISKIEKGKINVTIISLYKIANALGVDISALLPEYKL
ncbi:helix-turn-helix domain-containing protein [Chitinophaga ginsengisegetis]|uniref:helix-turn-helix domain-containing protein n=1 Tax=Chitinophaga ginsengisegetis TaxID=393003 RepID=UPI000DB9CBB5|nr:transcriptional regulator with XRE-family HTH domain [Chitinophaga ginsengisegetis]MDR6645198.1 transcriptional regulator with XRE-family HTH domain [Chitinophaga ginsengisegetis]MDR6652210.1 transcriptional regulator with XRE-family HTH domain [Chitinophaga ginsengisegetis]